MIIKEFEEILKEKREYYGNTEGAIEFAAQEFATQQQILILSDYIIKMCKMIQKMRNNKFLISHKIMEKTGEFIQKLKNKKNKKETL